MSFVVVAVHLWADAELGAPRRRVVPDFDQARVTGMCARSWNHYWGSFATDFRHRDPDFCWRRLSRSSGRTAWTGLGRHWSVLLVVP